MMMNIKFWDDNVYSTAMFDLWTLPVSTLQWTLRNLAHAIRWCARLTTVIWTIMPVIKGFAIYVPLSNINLHAPFIVSDI